MLNMGTKWAKSFVSVPEKNQYTRYNQCIWISA